MTSWLHLLKPLRLLQRRKESMVLALAAEEDDAAKSSCSCRCRPSKNGKKKKQNKKKTMYTLNTDAGKILLFPFYTD